MADSGHYADAGARASPGIVRAACWAHALRRFRDALPDHPEAERALAWMGALYDIDDRAGDDLARRAELRRSESRAAFDELYAWLCDQATLTSLLTSSGQRQDGAPRGLTDGLAIGI
ncbi:MAG TPA: transposase [Kofleriaceae bacterium]